MSVPPGEPQLTDTTGVAFVRTDTAGAALQLRLAPGVPPAARLYQLPATGTITRATAQWDPTHRHADRWRWEELLHAAGPAGDYGPPGAVLSTDQTASTPSAFDAWVLAALYHLETVPTDRKELAAALTRTQAAWLRPAADPGP